MLCHGELGAAQGVWRLHAGGLMLWAGVIALWNWPVIPCIFPPFAQHQLNMHTLSLQASNTDYIAQHSVPQRHWNSVSQWVGKQRTPQTSCCPFRKVQRWACTALCECCCTKPVRRCHAVVPWLAEAISLLEQRTMGSLVCPSAAGLVDFLFVHSSIYWPANTFFCCFMLETK